MSDEEALGYFDQQSNEDINPFDEEDSEPIREEKKPKKKHKKDKK